MDLLPSSRQLDLIKIAKDLARERFAPRAERHDREASFPFDDYADLRAAGFLGLCVPIRFGGLGADYETYCLVSEQIAQGSGATALTFNMHCLTMLMMGVLADACRHPPRGAARETPAAGPRVGRCVLRTSPQRAVEQGQTDTAPAGRARHHRAVGPRRRVVNGRKFSVSLAGSAPYLPPPSFVW
jgi:alkylation response protein AidB-like acyl-CoA dehydrogenase